MWAGDGRVVGRGNAESGGLSPVSTRAKRTVVTLVGVTALVILVLVIQGPAPGRLLDGTEVGLQTVSYGTNHITPKAKLDGVIRRFPAGWLTRMKWSPASSMTSHTVRSNFTFWLSFSSPSATTQSISYAIADEEGFEATMLFDGPHWPYAPGGFANNDVGLARGTSVFPRCSKRFFLRLYQLTESRERVQVAEFAVRNAGFQREPQWKPQAIPIQYQTNDLVFFLVKAEVGVSLPGPLVAPYSLQAGQWSEFRFRVTRRGEASAGWVVNEILVFEATGNRVRMSSQDLGAFNHQFVRTDGEEFVCLHRWPFWRGEQAWKLRVHFEQTGDSDHWIEYVVRPEFLRTPLAARH